VDASHRGGGADAQRSSKSGSGPGEKKIITAVVIDAREKRSVGQAFFAAAGDRRVVPCRC